MEGEVRGGPTSRQSCQNGLRHGGGAFVELCCDRLKPGKLKRKGARIRDSERTI